MVFLFLLFSSSEMHSSSSLVFKWNRFNSLLQRGECKTKKKKNPENYEFFLFIIFQKLYAHCITYICNFTNGSIQYKICMAHSMSSSLLSLSLQKLKVVINIKLYGCERDDFSAFNAFHVEVVVLKIFFFFFFAFNSSFFCCVCVFAFFYVCPRHKTKSPTTNSRNWTFRKTITDNVVLMLMFTTILYGA